MPPGYAEFATVLGEGTYGDGPQVKLLTTIRRDRWKECWFWDERLLTHEDATDGVVVADTDTEGGDPDRIRSNVLSRPPHPGRLGMHALAAPRQRPPRPRRAPRASPD
jgi:hypothetical protein